MSTLSAAGLAWRRLIVLAVTCAATLGIVVGLIDVAAASWLAAAVGAPLGAVLYLLAARAYGVDVRGAWISLVRFVAFRRVQADGAPSAKATAS
jgi:hypothetical protein